ncbi:hypothetical protein ACTHTU_02175 [Neisseria sp. P0020.S005]|uniref:hypothetical protein n=1 Tax=Neisseria sp. P0020.S005 TaxID=3436810 RepID=UPI003F7E7722
MQTLAMNDSFVRELTMEELDLIAGGWNWGNVNWGRAAAIGGAGAVGGGIAGSVGGPLGAGLGAAGGFVAGFGGAVINDAW